MLEHVDENSLSTCKQALCVLQLVIVSMKLTGLDPDTRYYYQVGNPDDGASEIMSFSTKDGNLVFAVSEKKSFFLLC